MNRIESDRIGNEIIGMELNGDLPNIAPSGRKIYIVLHLLDEIFFFHLILHLSDGNFEIC